MTLPRPDLQYLQDRGIEHTVSVEANMICVVLHGWRLPPGYDRESADLLVRLSTGYPDVAPDMWWFDPPVKLANGASPPATESIEQHLGRSWQRWSRHFQNGQWKSGIDGLESYLALICKDLRRWIAPA